MKNKIVYMLGLFEDQKNPLFQYIKTQLESIKEGAELCCIMLYDNREFGSYSFFEEVKRIEKIINDLHPVMIIAHSLGAYFLTQIRVNCQIILLDPSVPIKDIISNNIKSINGSYIYNDGNTKLNISSEFVESVKSAPTIKESAANVISNNVYIFGAGKGGHKIAIQYSWCIPQSKYFLSPNSDHQFSDENNKKQIIEVIKKQLGLTRAVK
jgi:hypothetical protein